MTDRTILGQFQTVSKLATALVPVGDAGTEAAAPHAEPFDIELAFRRHYRFVWRTILCMGVPMAAVDDAVQDVFMTAYRRRSRYDGRAPVRSWLFGIARNVARNHRRRRPTAALPEVATASTPDPAEHVARLQAIELVEAFLTGLDPAQRDVFVLSHIEGMTAPEIAVLLDVKVNTVYSRLRLSRAKFEQVVARERARQNRRTHGAPE